MCTMYLLCNRAAADGHNGLPSHLCRYVAVLEWEDCYHAYTGARYGIVCVYPFLRSLAGAARP